MYCHELAAQIQDFQPDASPNEVARLCLLLTNLVEDPERLKDRERLTEAWNEMNLKLQAAADQHAAMTHELELMAETDPGRFDLAQIWTLIRAIKVQSQILQLYLRGPVKTC